jgi:NAD(P)-dependent dehydrogenase (short-subunit alcohol dehydrogenase family)
MTRRPRDLTGTVVAITGGARGIGRATAEALLREGAKVALGDLDVAAVEQTAAELGPDARGYALNVTDKASFAAFLDAAERDMGPLDVLINNAGIMQLGPFADEDDAVARRQVDINLHGVIYGCKLALPRFRRRGRGHIVNIASQAGVIGVPGGATYCATKHAVVGLSEAIRQEHRDEGVDVTVVLPTAVRTELTAGLTEPKGAKFVDAEDVAAAIVNALKLNTFEVHVPGNLKVVNRIVRLLPRRAAEGIARALGADKVLTQVDPGKRASYEDRAAHSEPGLEPEAAGDAKTAEPVAG